MQKIEQKEKTYLNKGNYFRKEGKLDEAIEQYLAALKINPNSVPVLAQLAEIYEIQKKLEQAINCLQQILKLKPNRQKFFRQLMAVYSKVLSKKDNIAEVISIYGAVSHFNQ